MKKKHKVDVTVSFNVLSDEKPRPSDLKNLEKHLEVTFEELLLEEGLTEELIVSAKRALLNPDNKSQ